jgi:hypothetical protein
MRIIDTVIISTVVVLVTVIIVEEHTGRVDG